jgi:hypothetical protein
MSLKAIAPDEAWHVTLNWSRPEHYDDVTSDGSRHDDDGWLYMILGYFGSSHPKIFYIGKVVQSYVSQRLRQPDHRRRYLRLSKEHPRHTFKVTLGSIQLESGNITSRRIDQIETLLIYTTRESSPHMINERKWLTNRVTSPYVINNCGFRHPLPRQINFGIFIR